AHLVRAGLAHPPEARPARAEKLAGEAGVGFEDRRIQARHRPAGKGRTGKAGTWEYIQKQTVPARQDMVRDQPRPGQDHRDQDRNRQAWAARRRSRQGRRAACNAVTATTSTMSSTE